MSAREEMRAKFPLAAAFTDSLREAFGCADCDCQPGRKCRLVYAREGEHEIDRRPMGERR
jgi:hypothetical protein